MNIKTLLKKIESRKISSKDALELYKNMNVRNIKSSSAEPLYFKPVWEKKEFNSFPPLSPDTPILIFDTNEDFYQELCKIYEKAVLIKPGKKYNVGTKTEKLIYEINPGNKEDYQQLTESLYEMNIVPEQIIWMWQKAVSKADSTDKKLTSGIYALFLFTQSFMKRKPEKVRMITVSGSQLPVDGYQGAEFDLCFDQAVSGFAKTLRMENPKFVYSLIEFENLSDTEFVIDKISKEFEADDIEVRYENQKRLVKNFEEFNIEKEAEIFQPLTVNREPSTVLITGGMGGLGLIFAKYFAEKFKAKLVLAGRSDLDSDKESKLSELKNLSGDAVYIKADISEYEDVIKLINEAKSKFGKIDGIIHSAGVLRDSFVLNKTKEEMDQVLKAKIHSVINLDKVTKDEHLDFFVMFSSIASAIGNLGQCDYAYANAFMDSFAVIRENLKKENKRFGKTLSINWPGWKDGGMQVDKETEKFLSERLGMSLLETETGLYAFEKGLATENVQFISITGNAPKIRTALIAKDDFKNEKTETDSYESLSVNEKDLQNRLQTDLSKLISDILKVKESDIDTDADMREYGFDSIMLTSFTNKINELYDLDITPTLFFEYPSLNLVSAHLCSSYTDIVIKHYQIKAGKKREDKKLKLQEPVSKANKRFITSQPAFQPGFQRDEIKEPDKIEKDIAIIGISGRFPDADNVEEFWQNLAQGKDSVTEVPKDRWDIDEYFDPDPEAPNKTYCKWGGFLKEIDKFDPLFFNISPKEAAFMDPQQRLFLEECWSALEDAGYATNHVSAKKVGVFAGTVGGAYDILMERCGMYPTADALAGNVASVLSARIAYFLNLKGPNFTVDTACSSSLVAIHLACQSILAGESDMALAGGILTMTTPDAYLLFTKGRLLSYAGKCRTFDNEADGFAPGEGAGLLVLKSLSAALRDNDRIYGVIKGTGINYDGKTNGITAPSPLSQKELALSVYKRAGINPESINYVEAHGTATNLGDSIEFDAMTGAFRNYTDKKQYCPIGSVRTNIGHTFSSACVASIIKVLLAMKYKKIPPSLHFNTPNENIKFEESPFYVQTKLTDWEPGKDGIRRAAVNAFGISGTNAHAVIEEAISYQPSAISSQRSAVEEQLFVLSARNEERLKVYAQNMLKFLTENCELETGNYDILDVVYTLQVRRMAMEEMLAVVACDIEDLIAKLESYVEKNEHGGDIYTGNSRKDKGKYSLLLEGETGRDYIRLVIERKEMTRLAQLWVSGVDIDWNAFYEDSSARHISLPTYPFAKERYWLPEPDFKPERKSVKIEGLPSDAYKKVNEIFIGFKGALLKATDASDQELPLIINQAMNEIIDKSNAVVIENPKIEPYIEESLVDIRPYCMGSAFCYRSFIKPFGYAGDFETMILIYENNPRGFTLLGKSVDEYLLSLPESQSVRNRRTLMINEFKNLFETTPKKEYLITAMACGPAQEVFDLFENKEIKETENVHITCIDIEERALAHVKNKAAESGIDGKIETLSANLFFAMDGDEDIDIPLQHLMYSVGFIDYLEDKEIIKFLNWIYTKLEPEGYAVLGNISTDTTLRLFLDYVLDWKLIYRTPQDLERIFTKSKFRGCEVIIDDTGCQLFARAQKPLIEPDVNVEQDDAPDEKEDIDGKSTGDTWTRGKGTAESDNIPVSSESVQQFLIDNIVEKLNIRSDYIDIDRPFKDYGINSLAMIRIGTDMEKHFGIKIPNQAVFTYPTIREFSKYIEEMINA
jgi:3-oxoacyl-(acyl-carrier-protein) synthase/acyl carrier protein/NAD(P)-dependent dehydrogenase (short-subunit alcohol dehydrogenase family)